MRRTPVSRPVGCAAGWSSTSPEPSKAGAIYFLVGNRPNGPWSYTWRIGWGQTSFYIKSIHENFAEFKVSLHGEDPRHNNPMFKVDIDRSATAAVDKAGGAFVQHRNLPLLFPGIPIEGTSSTHVMRIRTTWDLFRQGVESAPLHDSIRTKNHYGVVPAPTFANAMDLDIYVSNGEPYWPNVDHVRATNAGMGPLVNKANDILTGVVNQRFTASHPPPPELLQRKTRTTGPRRRGFGCAVDQETGLLWIVEQLLKTSEDMTTP